MMTIKDCIDMVDAIKPNQYTIKDKVSWLSFIDEIIINEVLKTHEGYDGRYDAFEGYSEDKLSQALIVPSPYDRVYTAYLKMKIDQENGEVARYNNSATLYNSYMAEFRKHYNKTHMPIDVTEARRVQKKPMASSGGMSEAEYENLKRDLTYILTEHFADTLSHDKLYDVVMEYAQNNVEMLRGKDGEKGEKGKGISDVSVYSYTEEAIILEVLFDDGSRRKVEIPRGKEGPKGDKGDKGDKGVGIDYILISDDEESKSTAIFIYDTEGNGDSGLVRWGKDGYTPQKGVDYWTDADKAEIISEIPSGGGGTWTKLADITTTEEVNSIIATAEEFPDMPKCKEFIIRGVFPKSPTGEKVPLGAAYCYLNSANSPGFRFSSTTIDPSGITEHRCRIIIADSLIYAVGTSSSVGQGTVTGSTHTLVGDRFIKSDVTSVIFKLNENASLFPIGTRLYIYGKVEG